MARERLQMLLCMAPDDADARLLLSRIYAGGQRWQEAQKELDEAAKYGADVPQNLRHAIDEHFRMAQREETARRSVVQERDEIELCSLRGQVKSLRSENAGHLSDIRRLHSDVRRWAWATMGVAMLGIGLWVGTLFFSNEAEVVAAETAIVETPAVEVAPEMTTKPVATAAKSAPFPPAAVELPSEVLKRDARTALDRAPGLDDHGVTLTLSGDKLVASGTVLHFTQLLLAERVLHGVEGVDAVDVEGVKVLSATQGVTHVVASGDTLGGISQRYYGTSVHGESIAKANGVNPKRLQLGQTLQVPPLTN